jgi:hypothetical protein
MLNIMLIFDTDNKHNNTHQKHKAMKNTQLSTREDRTERIKFAVLLLAFPVIMVLISMLIS